MAAPLNVFVGERYGRLVVCASAQRVAAGRWWQCRCDCGVEVVVRSASLRSGHTQSCGCRQREMAAARHTTHGHTTGREQSTTYNSWDSMRQRCLYPAARGYVDYGGRGITICERWLGRDGFANFLADMGERPAELTLDRKDTDGNYEPNNCRWATRSEQQRNRRKTVKEG